MSIGFSTKTFKLLEELRDNNNREWFHAHKTEIDEHCREPFIFLLNCLTQELSDHSIRLSGGKQTMFRLNRDVRFAKDKSPYNHHISGTLTRSGMKNEQGGIVYLRLDPTGGRLGAGSWRLNAKRMGAIRDHMLEAPDKFRQIVERLSEADLEFDQDDVLKNMPRGYSQHAEHDLAWALRMKNFAVTRPMKRNEWKGDDLVDVIVKFVGDVTPLLNMAVIGAEKKG